MRNLRIFYAEDNRGDVLIVRESLDQHGLRYQMEVAKDGTQALGYVERVGKDLPPPDLLLLDLNLPHATGHEILDAFRHHAGCEKTPAIIVTSSNAPKDRERAAQLGADRYFLKSIDMEEFLQLGAVVKEVVGDGCPLCG
jgi:CheY-like chemotaxis protein